MEQEPKIPEGGATPPVEAHTAGESPWFSPAAPPPADARPAASAETAAEVAAVPTPATLTHLAAPEPHPTGPEAATGFPPAPAAGPDLMPITVERDGHVAVEEPAWNGAGSALADTGGEPEGSQI